MKSTTQLIKEYVKLVTENYWDGGSNRLGYLNAHIGSDYSYTDYLVVDYNHDDDTVTVKVTESSPYGGMDYKGHGDVAKVSFSETVPAEPKAVMRVIRRVINDPNYNFKKYGKASKNFSWNSRDVTGLNIGNLIAALEIVKR